jgi:hypothetical protein
MFYNWQKQFFENVAAPFKTSSSERLVATSGFSLIAIASSKKQGVAGRRLAPSSVKSAEVFVAVVNAIE